MFSSRFSRYLLILFFLLQIGYLLTEKADANQLATSEHLTLVSFSNDVLNGKEGTLLSNQEIIAKGDGLYDKASQSIDILFGIKKKELDNTLINQKAQIEKRSQRKMRLGKRKIKKWFKKNRKNPRAQRIAQRKRKSLRNKITLEKKKVLSKTQDTYKEKSVVLQKDYDIAHGESTSAIDRVYRYLNENPLGDDFFATMSIESLTSQDASMMHALGITTYRVSLDWRWVQSSPSSPLKWDGVDYLVRTASLSGLRILPAFHSTASGFGSDWRELPTRTEAQKAGWEKFIKGAVKRYGTGGSFWKENPTVPEIPITTWQIWNEANDHWFTQPVDPARYTLLLQSSTNAIKSLQPQAKIMASSLFGPARDKAGESLSPETFMREAQRAGAGDYYDYLSLHPYSKSSQDMAQRLEVFRDASREFGQKPIYITEVGWQSDNNTIFGVGSPEAQALELSRAYNYILRHHRRLDIRMLSWFAWRDAPATLKTCLACYGSGLLEAGGFQKKPAWYALEEIIRSSR